LQNGKSLHTFKFNEPCRGVKFSVGDGMAAISSDPFMGVPACIYLVTIADDPADQDTTILQQLKGELQSWLVVATSATHLHSCRTFCE
jgi:translation initiation factor 3 subunit I